MVLQQKKKEKVGIFRMWISVFLEEDIFALFAESFTNERGGNKLSPMFCKPTLTKFLFEIFPEKDLVIKLTTQLKS